MGTAAGGVLLAVVAIGLFLVFRKSSKTPWWLKAALAVIGGSALAETWLGNQIADLLLGAAGWVGGMFGWSPTQSVGVLILLWSAAVVLDIAADRRADSIAMMGLILLPILFTVGSGPIAEGGSQLTAAVQQLGQNLFGPLIGE
jgi:hypothetical protein